jgi:hypothetical protein
MTKRYLAGSEWRKWDLHVHLPGTRLSDSYEKKDGLPDWDRFADALETSDLAVLGITDYFSADQSLAFIEYFKQKFPDSEKLLLVNVELRLNETVNRNQQMVDFHVIFSDTVPEAKIKEFLSKLSTEITDNNARPKPCLELSGKEYDSATVTRAGIKKAFGETFGEKAEPTDFLIYIAPANNNGLRAQAGQQRKANLADEIDKDVHAIFGKDVDNSAYFLTTDRFEDKTQSSKPKPVFGGCDAHNFTDLTNWLGKAIDDQTTRQVVTWVKADPTFEGLQQTLVEPVDRVSLTELKPDAKDQYKVIKRVIFEDSTAFPNEIVFNPNLNAIIGSRSSGKSALLAHIAHAVDPGYTVTQQLLATNLKESEVGPAAGLSWKSVESTVCKVEWADDSVGGGQVIYIPQNWLFQISDNPKEVTAKIQPVLESRYPAYFRDHGRQIENVRIANQAVEKAVGRWFELAEESAKLCTDIKQIGDKHSIAKARDAIKDQIEELRSANSLSADDLERYQEIVGDLGAKRTRIGEIEIEVEQLAEFVTESGPQKFSAIQGAVSAETYLTPDPDDLPEPLAYALNAIVATSNSTLTAQAEATIVMHRTALSTEAETLTADITTLERDNKGLLEKHKANATLGELVKRQTAQQDSLDKIEKLTARRSTASEGQTALAQQVEKQIEVRVTAFEALATSFASEPRTLDQLAFGIAIGFDPATVRALSEPFRKSETGTFLTKAYQADQVVDIRKAQNAPADFLQHLFERKQKLNQGNDPMGVARQVLTASPEVRFTATLDQDRIGGFERSTMTPGKQALFALTLILGEAEDRWALLIDQPEDDLDSRSIYGEIVRYLVDQKKQRQIILVTHNANLVVGADAEEVLVANRHGDDRKNRDNRIFDYLSGSLEHSKPRKSTPYDLDRMGIREHAVEILDGGEEAFQKRRDKYKI